jgi:hypothetical protein
LKKYTLASKMTSVSFLQHGKNLQRLGTGTNKWWAFCRSTGWEFEENRHWNKWKAFYLPPPKKKRKIMKSEESRHWYRMAIVLLLRKMRSCRH